MTARRNGVKRLLMYVIVLIGALFIGLLAYYFAKNNETIASTVEEGEIIYINKGQIINLPIEHTRPSKFTKIGATSSNDEVLSYNESTKTLTANKGGVVTLTITTTNKDFGPFKFDIFVGEGSTESPWYISSANQLAKIGKPNQEVGQEFKITDSYELVSDINLASTYQNGNYWAPIPVFSGVIKGEGFSIINLKIASASSNVGFIGTLTSNASIENIKFKNVDVYATNATSVGVIAGVNQGFIGKVEVDGKILSSSETAFVGGIAGKNVFNGKRPTINMAIVKLSYYVKGNAGAVVALNQGGILFNISVTIEDFDLFDAADFENGLYSATYKKAIKKPLLDTLENVKFAGISLTNEAIVYESLFRHSAVKNVISVIKNLSILERSEDYKDYIALVSYNNVEYSLQHDFKRKNEYLNIIVKNIEGIDLIKVENSAQFINVNKLELEDLITKDLTTLGLTDIWVYNEELGIFLISFESSYELTGIADPDSVIKTHADVLEAFRSMSENPGANKSYTVELSEGEENVITGQQLLSALNITDWIPIGTNSVPFKGQFIVKNKPLVIENLVISNKAESSSNSSSMYGFFGSIFGSETIIKNLHFKNIKINVSSKPQNAISSYIAYAGVLAGYANGAIVEDITLEGIQILNASSAGMLIGVGDNVSLNNILIGKDKVNDEIEGYENIISNTTTSYQNIVYGSLIAKATGYISNIQVYSVKITNTQTAPEDVLLGGIAGTFMSNSSQSSVMKNAYNYEVYILNEAGYGIMGGIVAILGSKGELESSFSKGMINGTILEKEDYFLAGGLVGRVESSAKISKSFSSAGLVRAKFVGGLAAVNKGEITESYVTGEYKGHDVGGFTYLNIGKITHSHIHSSYLNSEGNSKKSSVAGFSVFLPKGGEMQYVYGAAALNTTGKAETYAETKTRIRYNGLESFIDNFFSGIIWKKITGAEIKAELNGKGKLSNYIVVDYGNAIVQGNAFGITPGSFIKTDLDSVMQRGSSNPFEKAGFLDFTPVVWSFESDAWPALVRCVIDPLVVVEEEA